LLETVNVKETRARRFRVARQRIRNKNNDQQSLTSTHNETDLFVS